MRTRRRLAVALAIVAVTGCARPKAELPVALIPVEHPDLGAIEQVAREQLEAQRSKLDSALAKPADRRELAGAFGGMAELYHAYELYDAAAACYRNAERLDPESFLWPYYLGALRQAAGDLEAAAASFERALEISAGDLPCRRRLGEVRLALGDAEAAREHFQWLLAGSDDDAVAAAAHFGLGRAAKAAGDAEQAVWHFERTLELQPDAGAVHYPLAQALRGLGRLDEARAQLAENGAGEVVSPDRLMERLQSLAISSGAYLKRGNQALMSGRLEEAEAELRGAVAADPEAAGARRNLALTLIRRGDVDGAIAQLEAAAEVDPDDVWIHVDLGNAYLSKGLPDEAAGSFKQAVTLDPELAQARFNLANVLIGQGRWSEARAHLEATLRLDPGDARARYQLAMANRQVGDHEAAIRELYALLKEQPTFTVARKGLAQALVQSKRGREAIRVYRQGIQLDLPKTEKIELLDAMANLLWRRNQRQEAIAAWRQAAAIAPESSEAWTNLANALQLNSGRAEAGRAEARELFARAVMLDPANATAWLSEARLWILAAELGIARQRLEAALAAVPDHAGLNDTLARLLATAPSAAIRDGERAMALARKAYALESSIEHAETFGMALAEAGRFEEAVRWQRSLINEAARQGNQGVMPRLVANLRRYEQRLSIRMSAGPRSAGPR